MTLLQTSSQARSDSCIPIFREMNPIIDHNVIDNNIADINKKNLPAI